MGTLPIGNIRILSSIAKHTGAKQLKVVPYEEYSKTRDGSCPCRSNTHSVSSREKPSHQGRSSEAECTIEISDQFSEGLQDIEHSPFPILLYWLDRAGRTALEGVLPHDPYRREHGVFPPSTTFLTLSGFAWLRCRTVTRTGR